MCSSKIDSKGLILVPGSVFDLIKYSALLCTQYQSVGQYYAQNGSKRVSAAFKSVHWGSRASRQVGKQVSKQASTFIFG